MSLENSEVAPARLVVVLLVLLLFGSAWSEDSHVKGNVPSEKQFHQLLNRDLKASLCTADVRYELLRKGPTQVGVALPKFYLWVEGLNEQGEVVTHGAMRVAAIEKEKFEVTHFLTAQEIRTNPAMVKSIFPGSLVAGILQRAEN